jgi:hypothetical protein
MYPFLCKNSPMALPIPEEAPVIKITLLILQFVGLNLRLNVVSFLEF